MSRTQKGCAATSSGAPRGGNPLLFQNAHLIHPEYGFGVVGNHEYGTPGYQTVEGALDFRFALGVGGYGCLIQNEQIGICQQRPRDS